MRARGLRRNAASTSPPAPRRRQARSRHTVSKKDDLRALRPEWDRGFESSPLHVWKHPKIRIIAREAGRLASRALGHLRSHVGAALGSAAGC
jgi:hypothetical protein